MDLRGAFIWRVVGPLSPSAKARLLWDYAGGDHAGRAIVGAVVKTGDVALDIGANIGLYTDRMARLVGPSGAIYAFEPNPHYARDLSRIAAARGNVRFIAAAVAERPGVAQLSVPGHNGRVDRAMGTLQERAEASTLETTTVPTVTLDGELGDLAGVRLLKCDVEGHEHEVLLGGVGLLRRERPVLLLELEQRHRRRPLSETFDLLAELGYAGYSFTAQGPRPLVEFDLERDQLAVIADDPATGTPPPGYVNDFAFMPDGGRLPI